MIERPEHFEKYKSSGELYRFIFSEDKKYSLHWANNGNKFWVDQENNAIDRLSEPESFILSKTPFEINNEAKLKVSIDYVTEKWNFYYCLNFRKKNKIKTIDNYIRYFKFVIED